MHRRTHAIAVLALAAALAGAIGAPAAAGRIRAAAPNVAPLDRHMPVSAALGAQEWHQS
ncbi:hypothetical protein [Streptomyces natalensis]|uniref:hypothetical protein n=1 Tax=Streptomyces natalensis TaxID=68242 RepID=UPI000AB51CA4|nr:hypothetical protein [Streptomyces natalensis]